MVGSHYKDRNCYHHGPVFCVRATCSELSRLNSSASVPPLPPKKGPSYSLKNQEACQENERKLQLTWDSAVKALEVASSFKLSPWVSSASWDSRAGEGKEPWSLHFPKSPKPKNCLQTCWMWLFPQYIHKEGHLEWRKDARTDWSLFNEDLQHTALGISISQYCGPKTQIHQATPLFKGSLKQRKNQTFPMVF